MMLYTDNPGMEAVSEPKDRRTFLIVKMDGGVRVHLKEIWCVLIKQPLDIFSSYRYLVRYQKYTYEYIYLLEYIRVYINHTPQHMRTSIPANIFDSDLICSDSRR